MSERWTTPQRLTADELRSLRDEVMAGDRPRREPATRADIDAFLKEAHQVLGIIAEKLHQTRPRALLIRPEMVDSLFGERRYAHRPAVWLDDQGASIIEIAVEAATATVTSTIGGRTPAVAPLEDVDKAWWRAFVLNALAEV